MSLGPRLPVASANHEELADWLELEAVLSADHSSSTEDLVGILRRTSSVDAIEDPDDDSDDGDPGSEQAQAVASSAFSLLEARQLACGGPANYPFDISGGRLTLRATPESSHYIFMLLLTAVGPTVGPKRIKPAKTFEELCTRAAEGYLGGPTNRAQAFRFGAPRKRPLGKLSQAVDHLCLLLNEGGGCKAPEEADHTGDAQLDIVAWREFPDKDAGKIIAFGQCAAGTTDVGDKMSELNAWAFSMKWFRDPLAVQPVRLFFVPWDYGARRKTTRYRHNVIDAGVVFDRCRIIACESLLAPLPVTVEQSKWTTYVLEVMREGRTQVRRAG